MPFPVSGGCWLLFQSLQLHHFSLCLTTSHGLLQFCVSDVPLPISYREMAFRAHLKYQVSSPHFKMLNSISSVQLLSRVQLFVTSWTAACQASLSITNSWSLLKLMSIKLVIPSNHLILCHPFLLLPSVFPSIRVFSNESVLCIRWPKYWSFSFSISLSLEPL